MSELELTAEFGGEPFSFAEVKFCDSDGQEVHVPTCDKCTDGFMHWACSQTCEAWICSCGKFEQLIWKHEDYD